MQDVQQARSACTGVLVHCVQKERWDRKTSSAEASFMLRKKLDQAHTDISRKKLQVLSIFLKLPPSYLNLRRVLLTGIAPGLWTAVVLYR